MTTQPYPNVDVTVPGLKQGVDMVLPLLLEPDDPNAPPLTADTRGIFKVFRRTVSRSGRVSLDDAFTLSTAEGSIVIREQTAELYFAATLSRALKQSPEMAPLDLYGTLFLSDAAGHSLYAIDLHLPMEASF